MKGILLATAILLIVTALPYVWCSVRNPAGTEFNGPLAYPHAFNSNLGWMRQVRDGSVLLTNIYDHHPPRHVFFHGFWVPLGLLSRVSGMSLITTFHVARWAGSLFLVWVFWAALRRCVRDTTPRRALLAFFMLGGGFGWMIAVPSWFLPGKPILPYDLVSSFYPFTEILLSAHLPVSHALVIAVAYLWSRGEETRDTGWFVMSGAAAALLATFHPYQIPTLWLGLLIYISATVLSNRGRIRAAIFSRMAHWIWLVLIPLPVIVYYFWLLYCVPGFASWRLHPPNVPPFWSFPFHLGPLILVAVWSRRHLNEIAKSSLAQVCGALFLSTLLIVHSPVTFSSSRQADIPLVGMGMLFLAPAAAARWHAMRKNGRSVRSKRVILALFILALGDSPLILAKRTATAQSAFPFQVPVSLLEVFRALDERGDFGTVVLSDPNIGPLIPRYAGTRACIGHFQVTSQYEEKASSYEKMIETPDDSATRDAFLREYNIDYWVTTPRSDRAAQDLPLLLRAGNFRLRRVPER